MRALVQTMGNTLANINVHNSWHGFDSRGWDIRFFQREELESLPLEPEVVVAGGGGTVQAAIRLLGRPLPEFENYPDELAPWLGRRVWKDSLGSVRTAVEEGRILFVKPVDADHKLFNGHVVRGLRDLLLTNAHPDDLSVLCSEVVDFVAEFRSFVHRGEVVGCRHYKGDFRLLPDFAVIEKAVARFSAAPVAYGLDFGVTRAGTTLLVEANDAYALGAYGLGSVSYSRMVEDRWYQMVGISGL